jgi:transposase
MPWRASSVMEERLRFVARLLDGEAMADVGREFGISRKTGYKIFDRYKEHGLEALSDRSRRPVRYANQLPQPVESLIVRLKSEKPHWGARKIRELLVRRLDGDVRVPAKSTIHTVLDRHGLVKRGGGPRHRARHAAVRGGGAQCAVVRRLQRRVQARQWTVLLPADRHRSRLALPAVVRGARFDPRRACNYRLRADDPRHRPQVQDKFPNPFRRIESANSTTAPRA